MSGTVEIEKLLRQEGVFVTTTSGVSMEPLFRERRDTVVIVPVTGRLRKYDVPLYRRGEDYVLHRIIEVRPDSYVIRGDNCLHKEFGITDAMIVGVMAEFYRKEKHVAVTDWRYRLYARVWVATHGVRFFFKRVRNRLVRMAKALLGK